MQLRLAAVEVAWELPAAGPVGALPQVVRALVGGIKTQPLNRKGSSASAFAPNPLDPLDPLAPDAPPKLGKPVS